MHRSYVTVWHGTVAAGKCFELCGPATTSNGHRFSIFFVRRARGEEEMCIHMRNVTGARVPMDAWTPPWGTKELPSPAAQKSVRHPRNNDTTAPIKAKLGEYRPNGRRMSKEQGGKGHACICDDAACVRTCVRAYDVCAATCASPATSCNVIGIQKTKRGALPSTPSCQIHMVTRQ